MVDAALPPPAGSLAANLEYQPQTLRFGTSGRRGLVVHLTQLEIYINALAELEYLQSLPLSEGGIKKGDEFYFARDLRPSSSQFVPEQGGRGELAQAIEQAIVDAGMKPVNLGCLPTPALTVFALDRGKGGMMITGSHIPFDRNGYKTNSAKGELLKNDEDPINARVEQVRQRLYTQPHLQSPFNSSGLFKSGSRPLPPENTAAREAYIRRYTDFFADVSLKGMRLLAYQHSAVGRDILVDILQRLGAQVIPAGRSETFVPIDTEAIDQQQLATIQDLALAGWKQYGPIDAVVSTDGDSDRPLILAVEPAEATASGDAPCRVRFFGGDLVGAIVAEYLGADAVVVPISCNDALDRGLLRNKIQPKTRIGSPFVITGMEKARQKGCRVVCGWEANGGFLTGSDITRRGQVLKALPTRDAILPILGVLFSASERKLSLSARFDQLPRRFSRSALLRDFPRPVSLRIIAQLSPADSAVNEVVFPQHSTSFLDNQGRLLPSSQAMVDAMTTIRQLLATFFSPALGFGDIARINYTDGVRIYFSNGDVAHVRPSGNADELRLYAVADTQARAEEITRLGVAPTDGILRRLTKTVLADGGAAQAEAAAVADFKANPGPLILKGAVQHYDWGGNDFIPALLGLDNSTHRPHAELWLGSHPSAPAMVRLGQVVLPLSQLINDAGEQILGSHVASGFAGQLPYLLKVLDAGKMLSIQAHPNLRQAAEGYARENLAGIPLKASNRNYKDANHKPEVHVALTDFWMLHGFRPLEEIAAMLQSVAEFRGLMPAFPAALARAGHDAGAGNKLLRELYQTVMTMPQAMVDQVLQPLIGRLKATPAQDKDNPAYWVLRADEYYPLPGGHCDRGIFSIYLLNLVHLKPGQGTYQAAGTLHAYLEGVNVELMANSDNVLRGGLTPKHMDVSELMWVLNFTSGRPEILNGEAVSATETVYRTPADEFELSRLRVAPHQPHTSWPNHSADILLVMEGSATLEAKGQIQPLNRGDAVLAPHGVDYSVKTDGQTAVLFKAAVPGLM